MNDLTPAPSPWLKALAVSAKWALRLLASAWVVMALVWGVLHFLIVPRIGELRPWLEQQASSVLGVAVRIGAIDTKSNGLIPSVELTDVRLLDPEGREALRLPSVIAALSPRSLLNLGLEQLYVDGAVLDIRRAVDGQIWVAGLPLSTGATQDADAAEWVFSQTEVALRRGTVRWTDELRGAPPLALTNVDLVLRNRLHTHALRLDADPPAQWGERLSVMGVFNQPLLSGKTGDWRTWSGQLYANFAQLDVARLRPYVDVGVDMAQGVGSLRVWADIARGDLLGATADVLLRDVEATVDPKLGPLRLTRIAGRLGARRLDGGYEVSTQSLAFDTQDGLHWPGGNVRLALFAATPKVAARGEFSADRLDLAALGEIAQRLPLDEALRTQMGYYSPKGLVESLQASWQGPPEQPSTYAAKGRVVRLALNAGTVNGVQTQGFQGADLDFDLTQLGGKASVAMHKGVLDLLGLMDEPLVAVDELTAAVEWTRKGEDIKLNIPNLHFSNADGQADVQLKWQTADPGPTGPKARSRYPGVLDLQGTASQVVGTRLYRYLPNVIEKDVRTYLQTAILGGVANGVKFKVKGDLAKFPFTDAKQGDFRISGNVQNASFAFAPAFLLPKDSLPWPVLSQLSGELVIDHETLQVNGAKGGFAGSAGLRIQKGEATISHLFQGATLAVNAEATGPVAEALGIVNNSPLGGMLEGALAKASATGNAEYRLKLGIPLTDVNRTTVQGQVLLAGNDLQITADTPRLTRARGSLAFTESGFTVTGAQARALGGDVRIEGGLTMHTAPPVPGATRVVAAPVLRMQGTVTAEGLRQARELGMATRLAGYASGSTSYTAVLGLRSGVPELQINTPLTGMALSLPAPFAKAADTSLPVRLETSLLRNPQITAGPARLQDQLQLTVGGLASVVYQRDISGPEARVLRGSMGVGLAGDESAPVPDEGVVANINVAALDLDAWSNVLSRTTGEAPSTGVVAAPGASAFQGYLPTVIVMRARELMLSGRKLNNVVVGGGRDGMLWRANLDATELSGYLEYRQPVGNNAGRLYARLARLAVGQSTAQDVETLLDEQPATIPALDIEVEDFELRGKKLGRVDIEAVNLGATGTREWRLSRFNIQTPEASLTASGNWAAMGAPSAARNARERRRTVLNFKLDISDAGDLLNRFGVTGVVRRGKGKVEGQVAWLGSPLTVDYPSLAGNFNVNVETGQFLKADPGIAKLLGVLSLQSLPRRLTLDFRDVFSEGFAFDFFRGDIAIEQGIARTTNLQMKGVNAAVLMEGQADIAKETQNLRVVVVPEINAGSASVLASIINPVVGLSTFLAQLILRGPLVNAATQEFTVDGTWLEPRVTKVERR
jgi:uncharacterized protein (TIGR02099 family)